MADVINVYILTGFLGAGKTTLLNHLLEAHKHQKNVVIENEFGKASIDGSLVFSQFSEVYELNNGCICCSLDEELYDVLVLLSNTENRADNLFIETTGVADAGSVASIFRKSDVSKVFRLQMMMCVADAETVEDYISGTQETAKQLVASDLVIINKIDFVSCDYVERLRKVIGSINPFAQIVLSSDGSIPLELISEVKPRQKFFSMVAGENRDKLLGAKASQHKMVSVTYCTEREFDKQELYYTLNVTLMLYYHQVYRIKGYVKLEGIDEKILLQSTGKRLTFESAGAWGQQELVSQLVFIGIDLSMPVIESILRPALGKAKNWNFLVE